MRLKETPKYHLTKGNDAAVVETFQSIANKYNRPCSLTVEKLESLGVINSTYGNARYGFGEFWAHIRGLFVTKQLAISTLMIWLSWILIGKTIAPLLFKMMSSLKLIVSRSGIPTLLRLPSGLSCHTRGSDRRVRTVLPVEKLHAQQHCWSFRACSCWFHVQSQSAWSQVHNGNRCPHHHGLLLRLHRSTDSSGKRWFELRDFFLAEHLLWHP